MFKAMLMLLWCLHTKHQKFANLNLTCGLSLSYKHKWENVYRVCASWVQLLIVNVDFSFSFSLPCSGCLAPHPCFYLQDITR